MKRSILYLLIFISQFAYAQTIEIDSLIKVSNGPQDTSAMLANYVLSTKLYKSDLDTSLFYIRKAVQMAEDLNFQKGKIKAYRTAGVLVMRDGQYEEAQELLNKGVEFIKEANLAKGDLVDMLNNLGVVHYQAGDKAKAIKVYIEAAEICRNNDLNLRRGRILNNLGIFFRSMKKYESALEKYEEAEELRTELKDTVGLANVLFNKTAVFAKMKRSKEALVSIDKTIELYKALGKELTSAYSAKAHALFDLGKEDEALAIFQSIDLMELTKQDELAGITSHLIQAEILMHKGQFSEALNLLNSIGEDLLKSPLKEQEIEFYRIRGTIFKQQNKYSAALADFEKFIQLSEVWTGKSRMEQEEEMRSLYETAEKDHSISLLEKEKTISDLKISSQNTRNIFLTIGLFGLGILSFFLYGLNKKIRVQNEALAKSEKDKTILLKEIHHRVKNNLQVISSLLNLQARKVKDENTKEALRSSKSRVQSMSILHQNLYNKKDLTNVNVKEYVSNLTTNLLDIYKVEKEIKINLDVDSVDIDVDSLVPIGLILNELLCNALKYAFGDQMKPEITVQFKDDGEDLILRVKDNGRGLDQDSLPLKKGSIGSKLITSFVDRLEGKLLIENEGGAGISILIPKKNIET